MAKRAATDHSVIEPDMTPMIDIVFQLLTFFMVAINFENTKADERVKLPKDALAKPPEGKPEQELVLNFGFNRVGGQATGEPVVFYNSEPVTLDRIRSRLEQEKRVTVAKLGEKGIAETTVLIRADGQTPTGQVQELIRMCQSVGYSKFSLRAEQDSE